MKKYKEIILTSILFVCVFSLACYITFSNNEFFVYDGAVQIYSSINKDIKILNLSSSEVGAIYITDQKNQDEKFKFELSINPNIQKNTLNQVVVKNAVGDILPVNDVKTKLFYNKLFDIRGKSIISSGNKDTAEYKVILKAEYMLLNGENKKIEVLTDEGGKEYILKTLSDNICYEIDKIQAEKFFKMREIVLSPKEIFYNKSSEIISFNVFSKSATFPMSIEKSSKDNLYNGEIGNNTFVVHEKDLQQFLSGYFKGNVKVASIANDKKILDEYGFDSPDVILDIKTDTGNKSIYFAKGKGSVDYYVMFENIPVIYETTLGKLPENDKINKYIYSFGDSKNLSSVVYRCNNVYYIFELENQKEQTMYKFRGVKVPSQVFFDLFDKFYNINVLEYTSIEGNYRLLDMKLAFKVSLTDKNDKETFANFYSLDDNKALMYVGEDDGFIINNDFVEDILKEIENLNE